MERFEVQYFLDHVLQTFVEDDQEVTQDFDVVFETQSGEQRAYTGRLVGTRERKDNVAFQVTEGPNAGAFKRFSLDRVLHLDVA